MIGESRRATDRASRHELFREDDHVLSDSVVLRVHGETLKGASIPIRGMTPQVALGPFGLPRTQGRAQEPEGFIYSDR